MYNIQKYIKSTYKQQYDYFLDSMTFWGYWHQRANEMLDNPS